jgi:BMFP domain-containing protein YqiC
MYYETNVESAMTPRNKMFDDLSQLMTNAMGVAQGARDEAENAMKSWMDRWLADRDFVTREEFDAVRMMAQKAREENAELNARLAALEDK